VLSVDVRFVPWLVEGHSTNSELKLCLHIDVQYVSTVPNLVDAPFVHATQGLPAGDLRQGPPGCNPSSRLAHMQCYQN
jgi:hypothetical protein